MKRHRADRPTASRWQRALPGPVLLPDECSDLAAGALVCETAARKTDVANEPFVHGTRLDTRPTHSHANCRPSLAAKSAAPRQHSSAGDRWVETLSATGGRMSAHGNRRGRSPVR